MIAGLHRCHAGSDLADDAGALMAEDGRKDAFRIGARERELVGVADAGGHDLDEDFAGLRTVKLYGRNLQRFAGLDRQCCANVHIFLPRSLRML